MPPADRDWFGGGYNGHEEAQRVNVNEGVSVEMSGSFSLSPFWLNVVAGCGKGVRGEFGWMKRCRGRGET